MASMCGQLGSSMRRAGRCSPTMISPIAGDGIDMDPFSALESPGSWVCNTVASLQKPPCPQRRRRAAASVGASIRSTFGQLSTAKYTKTSADEMHSNPPCSVPTALQTDCAPIASQLGGSSSQAMKRARPPPLLQDVDCKTAACVTSGSTSTGGVSTTDDVTPSFESSLIHVIPGFVVVFDGERTSSELLSPLRQKRWSLEHQRQKQLVEKVKARRSKIEDRNSHSAALQFRLAEVKNSENQLRFNDSALDSLICWGRNSQRVSKKVGRLQALQNYITSSTPLPPGHRMFLA